MLESSSLFTAKPVFEVVAAMRLIITSWLISGWPRQFWLMKENKRCSILFHLLVPGGKWQTEICKPVSSANCCNSHFHSLTRAPFAATGIGGDQQLLCLRIT